MKKINKYVYTGALLTLATGFFSSCDNTKPVKYEEVPPVSSASVAYFSPETPTSYELQEDESYIQIPVYRTNSNGPLSVPVSVEATENYGGPKVYTFPDKVSFADGEDETLLTITYDYDAAVSEEIRIYNIKLSENYTSPYYELDFLSVSLSKPLTFTTLGWIDYTDPYICAMFDTYITTYEVEIQECDTKPGYYRLVDPYGAAYPYNEPGDWDESVTSYLYIDATDPERVVIPESPQTLDWGYGNLICWCGAEYYQTQGYTADQLYSFGYFGILYNDIIYFEAETLYGIFSDWGGFDANYVYDEETGGALLDEDGYPYAPFWLDLSSISSEPSSYSTKAMPTHAGLLKDMKVENAKKEVRKLERKVTLPSRSNR